MVPCVGKYMCTLKDQCCLSAQANPDVSQRGFVLGVFDVWEQIP